MRATYLYKLLHLQKLLLNVFFSFFSCLQTSGLMSDDELSGLNIKDLNRKLKEKGLPKQVIERLKQRRRTLKNRKYATE